MAITLGGKTAEELGIRVLRGEQHPALPATRDRVVTIPGRHGVYHFGADLGPREILLECAVISNTPAGLQAAIRALVQHLFDSDGRPRDLALQFTEEPDKTYTVRYAGSLPVERIAGVGRFTLPLVAYDPHAYGPEEEMDVVVTESPASINVSNAGNAPTPPVIVVTNEGTNTITGLRIRRETIIAEIGGGSDGEH